MKKLRWALLILFAVILAAWGAAAAQEAENLTKECALKGSNGRKNLKYMTDGLYTTYWSSQGGKNGYLEVTLPKGKTAGGVYVKWYGSNNGWQVQLSQGSGWETFASSASGYLSDYLPLPQGTQRFRIAPAKGVKGRMNIAQLYVMGEGDTPSWVQRWSDPADQADMLVLVAHPDDEMLFMGGSIPYYAGELGKTVQVAYLVPSMPYRRLELLDGLWLCGVRNYPDLGKLPDKFAGSLKKMYQQWNKGKLFEYVTYLYRRYKPQVVVSHDVQGEYGHGAHRACADAAKEALKLAADQDKYPASRRAYGLWDVPKCYLHLYKENPVQMDWRVPLVRFDGKTAFEMAQEGFKCHISQQKTRYVVEDYGPYDNSLFGLYRSLVGPDEMKNDFFEHIDEG